MKVFDHSHIDDRTRNWPVHMARALEVAQNILNTNPNPRVGCVIVKNDSVLAEGWHVFPGQAHAEIMALNNARSAKADVSGSTVFVSLEPCAHQGKTGPCANALVDANVSTVVLASLDPNPKVAGKGVAILEAANIEVIHFRDFEKDAREINPGFMKRFENGLPFVRLKLAESLDGRTALSNGKSQWITGPEARADVQVLRAQSSAVLTGIGTVLADNPSLTVRLDELALSESEKQDNALNLAQQPTRVVLDSELKIPSESTLMTSGELVVFTLAGQESIDKKQAALSSQTDLSIVQSEAVSGLEPKSGVDLGFVLEYLAQMECNEVLIEAGPTLCAAFIKAKLVDELVIYIAPKLLGADSKPLLNITGFDSMDSVTDFNIKSLAKVGNDIKVILTPSE